MHSNFSKHGFTLVELAIVLVIAGLLAAGITVGRSIMHNSELQRLAGNFDKYRNAAAIFNDKYKALPGDFSKATSLWGTKSACDATANDNKSTATCNGNNDGFIAGSDATLVGSGSEYLEALWTWQHLGNAGLIEGTYSGSAGVGVTWWKPGVNMPMGLNEQTGFRLAFARPGAEIISVTDSYWGMVIGNVLSAEYYHTITLGGTSEAPPEENILGSALTTADAKAIDTKIDDGKPGRGKFLAAHTVASSNLCLTTNSITTAEYQTGTSTDDIPKCAVFFITGIR
ncbi:MAG: type II secretion system protein [Alphaproteobacteria bacterium]